VWLAVGIGEACGAEGESDARPIVPASGIVARTPAGVRIERGADGGDAPPRVAIDDDGYFLIDGVREIPFGAEEEHRVYDRDDLDRLIPRLHEMGVRFLVVYQGNRQEDYFYEELAAEGIFVAQHLGTLKKETYSPFPSTGGVIGTLPDEPWLQDTLDRIDETVGRLARFDNILFWWLGGELVEPEFHSPEGVAQIRDAVQRCGDRVRALDPRARPFTVSHHFIEVAQERIAQFIDLTDLTDFSWFTVATHFHLGDFGMRGSALEWLPVARETELPLVLDAILARASELNHGRPMFLGGWYANAPLLGPCTAGAQAELLRDKWANLQSASILGSSVYHATEWDDNGIPHALIETRGDSWTLTEAGAALREIARPSP